MINHELKDLFKKNSVHKKFVIDYDGGTITNSDMFMEEFSLEESLCSEEELRFGSCEASVIRFPISNVFTSLNGKVLDVSLVLDHNEDKPLKIGKYKVDSDIPTADRKRKDITAYDALYDVINANVADWYNALLPNADSTVTFQQFRNSFFSYFGIEQVPIFLVNDDMIVTKTIQPTELSGSMVANAICELNGCFGHINRDGLMDYVFLKGFIEALYPSDDLFPADNLFPSEANWHKYTKSDYPTGGCDYQEYVVKKITGLEIRQAEDSVGAFVGERENPYVVSDNFLTYGKSTEEMTMIAENMFSVIKDIEYRPFTLKTFRGNPCVEVGDGVRIYTGNQIIQSYVLNRTLTGIQALSDAFETNGREYRSAQVNSVEKSIIQLRGKTNVLERNIDETRSEITKVESSSKDYTDTQVGDMAYRLDKGTDAKLKNYSTTTEMKSAITQSAESITAEVSKTYTTKTETETISKTLSSSIEQTAEMIAIGIDANGNLVTDLTVDANGMTFEGNYLVINTKNLQLDEDGASFNGDVDAISFSAKDAIKMYQKINSDTILGGTVGEEVTIIQFQSKKINQALSSSRLVIGDGGEYYIDFLNNVAMSKELAVQSRLGVNGVIDAYGGVNGSVKCLDNSYRPPIGSLSNEYAIAYISSKPKDEDKNAWFITVNGKWGASEFASHNIISGSSDIRLKENVKPTKIKNALEVVNKFGVYEFDWKQSGAHQKIGFIADYLQEVDERLAVGGGYEEDGTPNYKSVDSFYMQGYVVKAIQELSAENRELKSEIDKLKQSVSFLMEKLGGMSNE